MPPKSHRLRSNLRRGMVVLAGILLLASVICVFFVGVDISSLAGLGYPGIAILMFLSSNTILLPAPGFAAVIAAGTVWDPLLVGLAAGVGASTGELSGYAVGAGGEALLDLKRRHNWKRAHGWLEMHGWMAIVLLAAVPNPLFDAIGLVAGSLSYPMQRFWAACLLGNSVKYSALAYLAGSAGGLFATR